MKVIKTAYLQKRSISMSRAFQHMTSGNAFAMFSSHDTKKAYKRNEQGQVEIDPSSGSYFVDQKGREQNNQAQKSLYKILKDSGVSWTDVNGSWVSDSLQTVEGKNVTVPEKSVFVFNPPSEQWVQDICKKFDQESYIYGENGRFKMVDTFTGAVMDGVEGEINKDTVAVDEVPKDEDGVPQPGMPGRANAPFFTQFDGKRSTLSTDPVKRDKMNKSLEYNITPEQQPDPVKRKQESQWPYPGYSSKDQHGLRNAVPDRRKARQTS